MDLKERYWWNDMKADVARFVAQCDVCQRVKAEHKNPSRFALAIAYSSLKMGRDRHGFFEWITQNSERE